MFEPDVFYLTHCTWSEDSATARLGYRFDDGPAMVETIRFPGAEGKLEAARRQALDRALRALHLAAGVSYYKAGVPPEIRHDEGTLTDREVEFFQAFYREGLGEFAWRNDLDLAGRPEFEPGGGAESGAPDLELPRRSAVTVGGGKDSIVALEMMRGSDDDLLLVSVGGSPLIDAVAERSGLPHRKIERRLAPELAELNAAGAWNGHVPITGIIGFTLVCGAILYGYDTVIMANERSASAGNLTRPDGGVVNHQYSKSLAFERAFGDFVSGAVLPGFRYFSLLRPLSELEIGRHFSFHEQYFDVFSSCNRNFTQEPADSDERWCRHCPKCRFVFLMLAPFVPRHRLIEIFGADMLDEESQVEGYNALLGLGDHKPFECVGEPEEVQAALCLISAHPDWREARVVSHFRREVLPGIKDPDALTQRIMQPACEHRIPERYRNLADAPG